MMFEIVCSYPFDCDFQDELIILVAGRQPLWTGTGACRHGGVSVDCRPRREMCWEESSFSMAMELKQDIELVEIEGIHVTVNEKRS